MMKVSRALVKFHYKAINSMMYYSNLQENENLDHDNRFRQLKIVLLLV